MPDPKYTAWLEALTTIVAAPPDLDSLQLFTVTAYSTGSEIPLLSKEQIDKILPVLARVALEAKIEEAKWWEENWLMPDSTDHRYGLVRHIAELHKQKEEAEREGS